MDELQPDRFLNKASDFLRHRRIGSTGPAFGFISDYIRHVGVLGGGSEWKLHIRGHTS